MSEWKDLLFGNLVGFSAVLVIGFMLLMAVFFIVAFLRLTRAPHCDDGVATSDAGDGGFSGDRAVKRG